MVIISVGGSILYRLQFPEGLRWKSSEKSVAIVQSADHVGMYSRRPVDSSDKDLRIVRSCLSWKDTIAKAILFHG